eukprot:1162138-Pelagomonas_calceolata.AAC.7
MGLPASISTLQRSKNLGTRFSHVARTPQDPVSISITLYQRRFKPALRRRKKRKGKQHRQRKLSLHQLRKRGHIGSEEP